MSWEEDYHKREKQHHDDIMACRKEENFLKAQLYESWKAIRAANRGIKRLKRRLAARDEELAELKTRIELVSVNQRLRGELEETTDGGCDEGDLIMGYETKKVFDIIEMCRELGKEAHNKLFDISNTMNSDFHSNGNDSIYPFEIVENPTGEEEGAGWISDEDVIYLTKSLIASGAKIGDNVLICHWW